jgi:succinylglutamic semialdehyde dehydrogenase
MVKCWEEAGLPAGVLNLVQGERETGVALAAADIDGLLFTGSCTTGRLLHQQFAGKPEKLLALEMGGNNALIVHAIDDVKSAVLETVLSAFTGSGQRCTCARRLILTDAAPVDDFVDQLIRIAENLQVGDAETDPQPFMGPLISNREADRLLQAQEALLATGAKPLLPMRRVREGLPFLSPGILDVTGVDCPDEEYFGPLLKLSRVQTLDDAISEANATQFGLSAGLFSNNRADFDYCLPRLRAGIINFNKQTTGASGMAPFGGIGCSGNHHAAGYYAADYCAYPVASMVADQLQLPETLPHGFSL